MGNPLTARGEEEKRKRNLLTSQYSCPIFDVLPRKLGSLSTDFLNRYELDKMPHLMNWFTAFMPLMPEMKKEDPSVINVKGDHHSKFAVSNWMAYSNTKAMLCGAGEQGHIIADKHRPFTNQDIITMLGIYILDGLSLSPQLNQKMQMQSKLPTYDNDRIATTLGPGYNKSIIPSGTSLLCRICL